MPKSDQIWPKIGIFGQFEPGNAALFGALLVGRLLVVVHGLYLARHLITLYHIMFSCAKTNQYIVLEYIVVDKIVFYKQTIRLKNWIHYISSMKGFPFLCGQIFSDK